jgi:hypothetical protein
MNGFGIMKGRVRKTKVEKKSMSNKEKIESKQDELSMTLTCVVKYLFQGLHLEPFSIQSILESRCNESTETTGASWFSS